MPAPPSARNAFMRGVDGSRISVDLAPMTGGKDPDEQPVALDRVNDAIGADPQPPPSGAALQSLDVERGGVSRIHRSLELGQPTQNPYGAGAGDLEHVPLGVRRESRCVTQGGSGVVITEHGGHFFERDRPLGALGLRLVGQTAEPGVLSLLDDDAEPPVFPDIDHDGLFLPRRVMIVGSPSRRARSMTSARWLRTSAMDSITGSLMRQMWQM